MSLDDLITLLLIVVFVGLPLLQRFFGPGKGGQGQGGPGPAPQQPTSRSGRDGEAPEARPGTRGSAPTRESAGPAERAEQTAHPARPQTAETGDGATELERRIAEARRRVQQAQQGQAAPPSPQPAAAPASVPRPEPRYGHTLSRSDAQPTGSLGREGVVRQPTGQPTTRQPAKKAPPLEVSKRRRGAQAATLSSGRVVSLKPDDIVRGIVWHQILGEPVSARTRRRQLSRDR